MANLVGMKRPLLLLLATLTLGAGGSSELKLGSRWGFQEPGGGQRFFLTQSWSDVRQSPSAQPKLSAASRALLAQSLDLADQVVRSEGLMEVCSVLQLCREVLLAPPDSSVPVAASIPSPSPAPAPLLPIPMAVLSQTMPNSVLSSMTTLPATPDDSVTLDQGLLLRRHSDVVGSLVAWKPEWTMLCDERSVGTTGQPLSAWEAELGAADEVWTHPRKTGALHLHRAGLTEVWLQVVHDQVPAALLVEAGSVTAALRHSGYEPSASGPVKPPESPASPGPTTAP